MSSGGSEDKRDEQLRRYAEAVRHAQIGLSMWSIGDPADPTTFRLVSFNPASEAIAGMPLAPFVGRTFPELAAYAAGGKVEQLLAQVARDKRVGEVLVERSGDVRNPNRALSVKGFALPTGEVALAIEDITEQTVARRLLTAENRVLELIAKGGPLEETLRCLVLAIEEHSPPAIGSILLLDADEHRVRHGAAPNLPAEYSRALDGYPIGPSAGSCGTAAFRKEPVFVDDIDTDPLWEGYRELARAHGLRACWSVPVLASDRRVLGTFAFYYREPRKAAKGDLETVERAAYLAGIAIERKELEEQLRGLSARVESVREEERTGIAREIHDQLGQGLTALKLDLAWIARRAEAPGGLDPDALVAKVSAMSQMTDDVLDQVRRISAELRPGVLDDLGLLAALEWQGRQLEERTGLICAVRSNVGDERFGSELSTAVFRIFQEALTNVARHADATHVEVSLELRDGWIRLDVKDDGKGISPETAGNPKALGLVGIRERARRIGGTATISGANGAGTTVSVRVPYDRGRQP
jgi:signal transduction histidine kinase